LEISHKAAAPVKGLASDWEESSLCKATRHLLRDGGPTPSWTRSLMHFSEVVGENALRPADVLPYRWAEPAAKAVAADC
jgi:hypothetical protein